MKIVKIIIGSNREFEIKVEDNDIETLIKVINCFGKKPRKLNTQKTLPGYHIKKPPQIKTKNLN